ncbi:MAG: dihydroorotate dehydrogenase electron transfer subunit [Treponema sp.]|jgi:NAD(P)H-flavin reductase|nr:dihydroorotate dehydrogenase electron transfer subunit [Treponema sp.]
MAFPSKRQLSCSLLAKTGISAGVSWLDFDWPGPAPRGGQFFMIRPKRFSRFLGRPVSAAGFRRGTLRFLAARRGAGTAELLDMGIGDQAELTGPLGNAWGDFLPPEAGVLALVSGGIGIAPLLALVPELAKEGRLFDFYGGFKTAALDDPPPGPAPSPVQGLCSEVRPYSRKLVLATEDGSEGLRGRIPVFFEPGAYRAVFACGPEPMLRVITEKCGAAGVPCCVSLERRMACGVGACLGCTVETAGGNRRCCADGPVFPAEEICFL